MAPFGVTSRAIREGNFILRPALSWTITPTKPKVAVPKNYDEETYFTPKGSLDRLLRDSRFLSLLKTLKKVPRILSWIEDACLGGCQICLKDYPEQRRMAISLCGHTMCDACLQRIMGDKMKSVYCPSCRKEIFVVLILDRPKKIRSLDNVRHFLLQDDTPVHDPSLTLGPLVSLWRLGKEYPITMRPCSVEPIPVLYSRMRDSKVGGPVGSPLKSAGRKIDPEEESYNRKSQDVIQSVLSCLGTEEDPFLVQTSINEGDLIDWNRVFSDEDDKPNANAQLASHRPYHPTLVYDLDVRMDCNFLNFERPYAEYPEFAVKGCTQTCCCEVVSDRTVCDGGMDEHSRVRKNSGNFENLIAQLPMNYKPTEPSNCLRSFISEGKALRRRLECPQWIMRVQVVPVIFENKMDDLIQLD